MKLPRVLKCYKKITKVKARFQTKFRSEIKFADPRKVGSNLGQLCHQGVCARFLSLLISIFRKKKLDKYYQMVPISMAGKAAAIQMSFTSVNAYNKLEFIENRKLYTISKYMN